MGDKDKVLFPGRGYRGDGMVERVKTDLRVPKFLIERVDEYCDALGIGKNAFFTLGASLLAAQLGPVSSGKKRQGHVRDLEKFVLKVLQEMKNAL